MSAREDILARIRKAHGRAGSEPTQIELEAIRTHIARHEIGPRPEIASPADPVAQFLAECERLGTTHAQAPSLAEVPWEVARYLGEAGLGLSLAAWPELSGLDWANVGVDCRSRPANGDDRTGLTGCFCAIAETGTLLLLSSPDTPKVTALLPETHIAVVQRSRLVATLEDAFAWMRREVGEPPRSTFFVSGPSRTADIEQTIVIGAHGPYRVHVILVG